MLPDLHSDFSAGRSDGLVFPSLSEFSTVYCDPHSQSFGIVNKAEIYVFLELSCHLILINHFSHSTNENWLVYNKNLTGKIDRKIHSFCQPAIYQWHLYMAFIIHLFRHLIIIYYIPRTELTSGSAKTNNVNLCFKNIETQSRRLMSQWNVTVIMWWGW